MVKFILICIFVFGIMISGCASIKETSKCVAGVSTKVLEEGRNKAIKKSFKEDYKACYSKAKECLISTGSYIYAEDPKQQLIAAYLSETDTTPVGIFFKEIDAKNTQIEVSSPSTYVRETVAMRIFNTLEGIPIPMPPSEEEGKK